MIHLKIVCLICNEFLFSEDICFLLRFSSSPSSYTHLLVTSFEELSNISTIVPVQNPLSPFFLANLKPTSSELRLLVIIGF